MEHEAIAGMAERLGKALRDADKRIAVAESCTGGGLGYAITAMAGSSNWFERGYVTYSNDAKQEMLGVPPHVLEMHGAVSEETAAAMASGALKLSGADLAVSITGIAGPGGGSPDKPVGTVCFGWSTPGETHTARTVFKGSRQEVREQSILLAMQGLLELVEKGE